MWKRVHPKGYIWYEPLDMQCRTSRPKETESELAVPGGTVSLAANRHQISFGGDSNIWEWDSSRNPTTQWICSFLLRMVCSFCHCSTLHWHENNMHLTETKPQKSFSGLRLCSRILTHNRGQLQQPAYTRANHWPLQSMVWQESSAYCLCFHIPSCLQNAHPYACTRYSAVYYNIGFVLHDFFPWGHLT